VLKREVKRIHTDGCRCDERLNTSGQTHKKRKDLSGCDHEDQVCVTGHCLL
jgi:hypothetical protein